MINDSEPIHPQRHTGCIAMKWLTADGNENVLIIFWGNNNVVTTIVSMRTKNSKQDVISICPTLRVWMRSTRESGSVPLSTLYKICCNMLYSMLCSFDKDSELFSVSSVSKFASEIITCSSAGFKLVNLSQYFRRCHNRFRPSIFLRYERITELLPAP